MSVSLPASEKSQVSAAFNAMVTLRLSAPQHKDAKLTNSWGAKVTALAHPGVLGRGCSQRRPAFMI